MTTTIRIIGQISIPTAFPKAAPQTLWRAHR